MLIVEVEKLPMLYDKDRPDFKDVEKKCVETYCYFHEMVDGSTLCDFHSPNYRVLYER